MKEYANGKITAERDGPVTIVTINRAEVRNAMDDESALALGVAFREFDADPVQQVAVLTGASGAFCAGADLKALSQRDPGVYLAWAGDAEGPTNPTLSKPVIAAVEGHAVAGALGLALWCDIRVIDEADRIMADRDGAYWDSNHVGHRETVKRVNKLLTSAMGEIPAVDEQGQSANWNQQFEQALEPPENAGSYNFSEVILAPDEELEEAVSAAEARVNDLKQGCERLAFTIARCLMAVSQEIAYYLYDLAAAFHGLWTKGKEHTGLRFIIDNNQLLTARLALVGGVRIVIASGLEPMGVVPVEELR